MPGERKVENWNPLYPESAVVDPCGLTDLDLDPHSVESPLGVRQLARGHGTMVNNVAVRAEFLYHFAAHCEWVLSGQLCPTAAPHQHSHSTLCVVELSSLGA